MNGLSIGINGTPSTAEWIQRAVAQFEKPLTLYAARLLGDPERARDVVQETFLRLCDQDERTISPRLAEWLYTVCRNRALDVRRKEKRMTLLDETRAATHAAAAPDPAAIAESRDESARLLTLLDRLPANQRETIVLKFQQGFSYQQISRVTSLSVTNVGYLIHTGLKTLRQHVAAQPTKL